MIIEKNNSYLNINQIFAIGVFARIIIYIYLILFPFYHLEQGVFGSWVFQNADFFDYLFVKNIIFFNNEPFLERCVEEGQSGSLCMLKPLQTFILNYKLIFNSIVEQKEFSSNIVAIVGPIFPIIITLTNYSPDFPYLLSILCIFTEIIALRLWSKQIIKKSSWFFALLFVFLPIPLIFGFIHSSDIFFYFFSTLIILFNFKKKQTKRKIILLCIYILIVNFLRPAGILLSLSLLLFLFFNKETSNKKEIIVFIAVIFLLSFLYYLPYLINEFNKVSQNIHPDILNLNIFIKENFNNNLLSYIFSKIYYFLLIFGFDSSQSGVQILNIIKPIFGIVFLLGFIFSLKNFRSIITIYILLTVITIYLFSYPSYRYLLPIIPLLFLNFSSFINKRI